MIAASGGVPAPWPMGTPVAEVLGAPDAGLRLGAEPDRGVGVLDGADVDGRVIDVVVVAVEVDAVVGPQLAQQPQPLLEARDPLLERHAERLVLGLHVAEPEADVEPALADDVERRELLGEHHRVVERRDHDLGRQAGVGAHLARQPGERRHRLQPARAAGEEEVLADQQVGDPRLLGRLDLAQDAVEVLGRRDRGRVVAKHDSDVHRYLSESSASVRVPAMWLPLTANRQRPSSPRTATSS